MAILDKQALEGGTDAFNAAVDGAVWGGDVVYSKGVEMVFKARGRRGQGQHKTGTRGRQQRRG
jgi:hypothetical protein